MTTSAKILAQVRELPLEERLTLSVKIAEEAASERARELTDSERTHIEGVLSDRIDGPFEPLPSEEEFMTQVKTTAAEIGTRRDG